MKGKLLKKDGVWFVSYNAAQQGNESRESVLSNCWNVQEIPLCSDDIDSSIVRWANNGSLNDKEIEFEIVEADKCSGICMKMAHDYSDDADVCLGGCEDVKQMAKLVTNKQNDWSDLDEFCSRLTSANNNVPNFNSGVWALQSWLKNMCNPTKKKNG